MDLDILGKGLQGTVFEHDGKAIKRINIVDDPTDLHWVVETSMLNHFKSRVMPSMIDVHLSDSKYCDISMKKYTPLTCFDTDTLTEDVKEIIIRDVGEAVMRLHHFGIIHTDIKRSNILLDISQDNILKGAILCDFGLIVATNYDKLLRNTNILTSSITKEVKPDTKEIIASSVLETYPHCSRPPEVVNKIQLSSKSDIWAFGCLWMSLYSDTEGISISSIKDPSQEIIDGLVDEYVKSTNAATACKQLLRVEPSERASIEGMIGVDLKRSAYVGRYIDIAKLIYDDNIGKPYEIIIHILTNLAEKGDNIIRSMIKKWNDSCSISQDCVFMFLRLITRLQEQKHTGIISHHVFICVHMAITLFHRQIYISMDDVKKWDHTLTSSTYPAYVFQTFKLFDFDLFK